MEKTYAVVIYNPATGEEETVPVTKEVYDEFRRDTWRSQKSDYKYMIHTCSLNNLIGKDVEQTFDEFIDKDANIEELIIQKERLDRLSSALSQLTEQEKMLVDALYSEGLTIRACATKFGLSKAAVQRLKARILKKLKKLLI